VVETECGTESAVVADANADAAQDNNNTSVRIIRKANLRDLNIIKEHQRRERDALVVCRKEVKKFNLPMKIVDCGFSFDGGSITFAFIADGRVDFRELVKSLSKKFQRSIRFYQIGARDETRRKGGYGICGRELCCVKFKNNLPSIGSEMAKVQQVFHRGSERISGVCGRLMCCLAYEAEQYQEALKSMPNIGDSVKIKEADGVVKEINILTGEIKVELKDGSVVKVNKEDI